MPVTSSESERDEQRDVAHHVTRRLHLDRRQAGDRQLFGSRDRRERRAQAPLEIGGDELVVAHRLEAHPDAGGAGVAGDEKARREPVGEHALAQRRDAGRVARQRRHERRALQAVLVHLDPLHGAQAGHFLDARQGRERRGQTIDARERRRGEDVVGEDPDDDDVLAAERAAHALVVDAVRVALRQQPIDGTVHAESRREHPQTDRQYRRDQQGGARKSDRQVRRSSVDQ